jgi:FSR family fosmidomycin resistance protein-like MFS transporter
MIERQNKLTIALLSAAHFVLDSYSSFLMPLLPLLAAKLHLTPAQAGWLVPATMITSSLMQPVYGMISDRYLKRSMSVFGPLVAAVFISSIGLASSLPMLLAFVILGGIGTGAFHPQSAALVARASTRQQATVMSIFSSAGTVGMAVGPILVTNIVARYGLDHTYYAVVCGVVIWVLLLRYCPPLEARGGAAAAPPLRLQLCAVWAPLALLYFAVVLRSATHVSVQTYLPFSLSRGGLHLVEIGWVLSGFILFGGVGGFFGGALADALGARRVSLGSLLVSGPLLIAAFSTHGWLSYGLLAVGGTFLNVAVPVNVVMAQRLVPGGASTVSALMMGFAWGAGALLAPVTGALSERVGFTRALIVISLLPLLAAALMWRFPKDAHGVKLPRREALAVGD